MEEKKIKIILIFMIMLVIGFIVILISEDDFSIIRSFNKVSTEMEYEKMKEYINKLNMDNINAYQRYQNELQRNYYIDNKYKRPANNIDIKSITISFVEEYNSKYIYKMNSTSDIETFMFNHAPSQQQGKVLYGDLQANLNVKINRDVDYYFAKDKKSNEYIEFKAEDSVSIFGNATCVKDLNLLKSNL